MHGAKAILAEIHMRIAYFSIALLQVTFRLQ